MTGARSTYQNRWRMALGELLHFVARCHSTWPLLFVIAGFKSAIFSKHVQSLQLLRDELALQNQQLDLFLIGDVAVAAEILAQALSEVIMSPRVVFPEVHQLQGDVTTTIILSNVIFQVTFLKMSRYQHQWCSCITPSL